VYNVWQVAQTSDSRMCADSTCRKPVAECISPVRPCTTGNGPKIARPAGCAVVSMTKPPVKLPGVPSFSAVIW
jgi:hypothetical protein